MAKQVQDYKVLFTSALRPFIEMFEHQRRGMDPIDWRDHVNRVLMAVVNNPEQYLGQNLPPKETTTTIVLEIFNDLTQGVLQELT
jgi:hypothetical protein